MNYREKAARELICGDDAPLKGNELGPMIEVPPVYEHTVSPDFKMTLEPHICIYCRQPVKGGHCGCV